MKMSQVRSQVFNTTSKLLCAIVYWVTPITYPFNEQKHILLTFIQMQYLVISEVDTSPRHSKIYTSL